MTPTANPNPTPAPATVPTWLQKFLNDAQIAEQTAMVFAPIAPEAAIALAITQGISSLLSFHVAVTGKALDLSTLQEQPEIPIPAQPVKS